MKKVTAVALGLAISSAIILVALRLIHCFEPNLWPWSFKSAFPLILIGLAFAAFQFVSRRTPQQILLGLMVAVAFILWGTEQFISNPATVALMDDFVVFMFVLDLSVVIFGHLKPGAHPASQELPFDEPGE